METRERTSRRVLRGRLVTALLCLAAPAAAAGAEPPAPFADVLLDPRVAEALVWDGAWDDGDGPRAYPSWDDRRREELHRELTTPGGPAAPAAAPELAEGRWLAPESAWRVYLAHVAHALRLEQRREVAWSLRSLTPDQAALLLDGRNLLEREPGHHRYSFGPAGGVAVHRPEPVFEFLRRQGILAASEEETVYALAAWVRRSLRPSSVPPADPPGPVPLDLLLDGAAAGRSTLSGCRALSGLLAAALRSVNVPVRVAESPFAQRGGEAVHHSRLELPTLGRGLAHSADLYAHLALESGNAIPTASLFPTLGWIRDQVESPRQLDCAGGTCHTPAEQALFNTARRLLALAAVHLPDGLLIDRASDSSASVPPERLFETLASGCSQRPGGAFVRPLFADDERRAIARRADEEIERAGGGDWARGAATVRQRWRRALEDR